MNVSKNQEKEEQKRIKKDIHALIKDLKNHLFLLDKAIEGCKTHPAYFIQIATTLRTLATKGQGQLDLLPHIARQLNVKLEVTLTEPHGKISYNAYLQSKDVEIQGKAFSNQGFIKLMCNTNGDFLHTQETQDERIILGNRIVFFEINVNNRQLLAIARTTSSMAHSLLTYGENMPKQEQKNI